MERIRGRLCGTLGPRTVWHGFSRIRFFFARWRKKLRMEDSLRRTVAGDEPDEIRTARNDFTLSVVTPLQLKGGFDSKPHLDAANCAMSCKYPADVCVDAFLPARRFSLKLLTAESSSADLCTGGAFTLHISRLPHFILRRLCAVQSVFRSLP